MDASGFIELTNGALITAMIAVTPILVPGLVVGILISLFQAVTQISEQTLSFVPKLLILILSYLITGPWIMRYMSSYAQEIFEKIPEISRSAS
jgi:flagellar biosynthesis protein FliQ